MSTQKQHLETIALHAGQVADPTTDACAVPIYQTASYVFHNAQHAADRFGLRDAGNIYGRLTNSTQGVLEDRIAALEGGVAGLAVASGAAAITYSLQNVLQAGDHIVAADNLYGGSYNLITHTLAASGIAHSIVKINDLAALEAAILPNTKVIFAETLGNPNSDVLNIEGVAEVAHKHGIVFDGGKFDWKANADRYPSIAKPDASYHGAVFADVAGPAAFVTRIRAVILRDTGAAISPFNAWILLQGVESLPLRIERHTENALKVVEYLAKHPLVEKVNHPAIASHPDHALYEKYFPQGGASIFTFEIKGGEQAAWKFIDALQIFTLLANVADVKSLVIHPATTTHSQLSPEELAEQHITSSTIRLSVGVEHIDDIIADLEQAFNAIK